MRGSGIMLRRLNDALPGLVLGIIVYGAAVFLAGIWFVPDKVSGGRHCVFRDDEVGAWQSAGSIYWCFGIEDISVSAAPCT